MTMNPTVLADLGIFVRHFPFINNISNVTILVTGATGLIGSTIVRCLLALNKEKNTNIKIIGVIRDINKAKKIIPDNDIEWLVQDLMKPFQINDKTLDYIIHCASPTSSKYYIENPVELIKISLQGSISLLEYAKCSKVKGFVYLSSCEVYGSVNDDSKSFDENFSGYVNPVDVRSSYPMVKRMVETLCHSYWKEYGVPVVIARLTQTFGAGVSPEDNRVFAQFAKSAINGEDIELHTLGLSAKPYCYTIDAITALFYLLFEGEPGDAYNVANEDTYISIKDLAEFISKNYSSKSKVITSIKDNMGYAPETKLRMSTDKLKNLGWTPLYTLKSMFDQLIEYYKTI